MQFWDEKWITLTVQVAWEEEEEEVFSQRSEEGSQLAVAWHQAGQRCWVGTGDPPSSPKGSLLPAGAYSVNSKFIAQLAHCTAQQTSQQKTVFLGRGTQRWVAGLLYQCSDPASRLESPLYLVELIQEVSTKLQPAWGPHGKTFENLSLVESMYLYIYITYVYT